MDQQENLNKLKKSELIDECKKLNINYKSSFTKSELIVLLKNYLQPQTFNYEKPILKWVGGKTQIIDKVINEFPKIINNYHELFIGGGSVLLALLQNVSNTLHPKEPVCNIIIKGTINAYDYNETLINLYKNIQTKPKELYTETKKIIDTYCSLNGNEINRKPKNINEAKTSSESFYYWTRNEFNNMKQDIKNSIIGSAYFIYLNKTCFRGLYREGPNGFNVPYGHYNKPEIINEEHLYRISTLIKNVNFFHSSFEKSFEKIKKNDFIYLDPPYAPENNKSFVGYTSGGFSLEQHNLLFTLSKKYNFLMSNADVELVKNNYLDDKYTIITILCKRSINSKNPESKTNEILIKSY